MISLATGHRREILNGLNQGGYNRPGAGSVLISQQAAGEASPQRRGPDYKLVMSLPGLTPEQVNQINQLYGEAKKLTTPAAPCKSSDRRSGNG